MGNDTIMFGRGGFQEARGSCGSGGHEYYIENIRELLDSPGEFFLDETTRHLYYWPNGTSLADALIEVPQMETLLLATGTAETTLRDVHIVGLTLRHSQLTFMGDWEVPSGGDWSVHRGAMVELSKSEDCSIEQNLLDAPGGNGILVDGYARNARIAHNEIVWSGESGILVLGPLYYDAAKPWDHSDGQYPQGTVVVGNFIHEMGIFVKQTGGLFQALASDTHVDSNIIFNGPRSGINQNDAFAGNNTYTHSLMFNLVRETVGTYPML